MLDSYCLPFSFEMAKKFPSSSAKEDGQRVARVIHGLERAPITAILEHSIHGQDLRNYSHVDRQSAKIILIRQDETTKRANQAVSEAEKTFEEEEASQITDSLRALPSRSALTQPIHSMMLEGEPVVTERSAIYCNDSIFYYPKFEGHLAIAKSFAEKSLP